MANLFLVEAMSIAIFGGAVGYLGGLVLAVAVGWKVFDAIITPTLWALPGTLLVGLIVACGSGKTTFLNILEGHTLIVVTHDIHVGEIADRLITLEHGRVAHSQVNRRKPMLSAEVEAGRIPILQA